MNHIKKIEDRGNKAFNDAVAITKGELSPGSLSNQTIGAGTRIVKAIVGNKRHYEYSVNLPNEGYVSNLREKIVVEVPASVDKSGIHGVGVGALPKGIAALCNIQGTIQELAVEAAFEGSYEKALQALLIDPVVHDAEAAKATLNDLLKAHASVLPLFRHQDKS
jgi:alpha-galactosidase